MKKSISGILLVFLCSLYAFRGMAGIRLPALISDGMVLQQKAEDPLWGWAVPGADISVQGSWMENAVRTKAGSKGKWQVKIKAPEAGGPYTIRIRGKQTVVLHNVMVGEVWVCSGQSNMEMPVSGWANAPLLHSGTEIQNAHYPDIRLFTVKKEVAVQPQEDCSGTWAACTPETVKNFSATAYFYGRALYKKLKVPIGLIHSSWGGTVAEAWTGSSALRKWGDFNAALDRLDSIAPHVKALREADERRLKRWNHQMKEVNAAYASTTFDDSRWKRMKLPAYWEAAGYPGLDGIVWFRKVVNIPADWAGEDLKLDLGPIDDEDITWFNGHTTGAMQDEGHWSEKRSYEVPGKWVKSGKSVIAVRVTDLGDNGGIYGDKKWMKLYPADHPDQAVSLSGYWHYKIAVVKPASQVIKKPNTPSVLFNGMIAPLIPFRIRGVIWYQGESNVGRAVQYAQLFPTLIRDWRARWQEGPFPFYYVQIAPYPYGGDGMRSAALRDAQRRSLRLPHTGMVVTLDIGDTTNIHPANKQEVGRRLSLWALTKVYGEDGHAFSGPLYQGMKVRGNKVVVSFDHAAGGLVAKGGKLVYFEIAGDDGHFVPAQAAIEGESVEVYSDKIAHPSAVRFAWRDEAVPHLFNKAGLPASTFTSEPLK